MAFNRDLQSLEKSMRSVVGTLDQASRSAVLAQATISKLSPDIIRAEKAFAELTKSIAGSQGLGEAFGSLKTAMGSQARQDIVETSRAVSDMKAEMNRNAVAAKVLAAGLKIASFRMKDTGAAVHGAIKGLKTLSKTLDAIGGGFSKAFSSPETAMGGFRKALLSYNQLMLESMRMNTTLGRSEVFQEQFWSKLKNNTELGRDAFLSLNQKMNQLIVGVPLTRNRLLDLSEVMSNKMGASVDKVNESFQRFIDLQGKMPRLQEHLDMIRGLNAAGGGQGQLDKTLLFFKEMGADNRSLNFLSRYVEELSSAEQGTLKFEKAMSGRNQSIQDFNTLVSKDMEGALTGIENVMSGLTDSLTTLTRQLEKMTGVMGKAQILSQGSNFLSPAIGVASVVAQGMQMRSLGKIAANTAPVAKTAANVAANVAGGATYTAAARAAARRGSSPVAQSIAAARRGSSPVAQSIARHTVKGAAPVAARAGLSAGGSAAGSLALRGAAMVNPIVALTIVAASVAVVAHKLHMKGKNLDEAEQDYETLKKRKAQGFMVDDEELKRKQQTIQYLRDSKEMGWQPFGLEERKHKKLAVERTATSNFMDALNKSQGFGPQDMISKMGNLYGVKPEQALEKVGSALKSGDISSRQAQEFMKQYMPNSGMTGGEWQVQVAKMDENLGSKGIHDKQSLSYAQLAAEAETKLNQKQKITEQTSMMKLKTLQEIEVVYGQIMSSAQQIAQEEEKIGSHLISIGHTGSDLTGHYKRRSEALKTEANAAKMVHEQTLEYLELIKKVEEDEGTDDGTIYQRAIQDNPKYEKDLKSMQNEDNIGARAALGDALIQKIGLEMVGATGSAHSRLELLNATVVSLKSGTAAMTEQAVKAVESRTASAASLAALASVRGINKANTVEMEAQALLYNKQQAFAEHNQNYVEKMALGMAASYAMRQESYNLTRAERLEYEKMAVANTKTLVETKSIKDTGIVSEDLLKRVGMGDRIAFQNAKEALIDGGKIDAAKSLVQQYNLILDTNTKIVQLKSKELDLTMSIREGFLDVIDEMTTGSDLISRLLPNAERGRMQLLDMSRLMSSADFGGAMRVGFASMTGFGDATMAGNAPRYGPFGLSGHGPVSSVQEHIKYANQQHQEVTGAQFVNPSKQSDTANIGIGNWSGPLYGGRAKGGAVNIANGGVIPGTAAAGRDNMFGYLNNGERVIVGSGEGFIPAKMLSGNGMQLAEYINSGALKNSGGVVGDSYNAALKNPMSVDLGDGGYIIRKDAVPDGYARGGSTGRSKYKRWRAAYERAQMKYWHYSRDSDEIYDDGSGVYSENENKKEAALDRWMQLEVMRGGTYADKYEKEREGRLQRGFKRAYKRFAYLSGSGKKHTPEYHNVKSKLEAMYRGTQFSEEGRRSRRAMNFTRKTNKRMYHVGREDRRINEIFMSKQADNIRIFKEKESKALTAQAHDFFDYGQEENPARRRPPRSAENPYRSGRLQDYYKRQGKDYSQDNPLRAAQRAGVEYSRSKSFKDQIAERNSRLYHYNKGFGRTPTEARMNGGIVIPDATVSNFFDGGDLLASNMQGLMAGGGMGGGGGGGGGSTMTGGITIENLSLGGEVIGKRLRSSNDNAFELIKIQNRG